MSSTRREFANAKPSPGSGTQNSESKADVKSVETLSENFGTLDSRLFDFDRSVKQTDYVAKVIKFAETQFKLDRGRKETKKANLGDIRSTKI